MAQHGGECDLNKPRIELWDSVGFGLILQYPTGVMVTNQTGGYCCLHPEIEGIYIPFNDDIYVDENQINLDKELNHYFVSDKYRGTGATQGIDKEDAQFINHLLEKCYLGNIKVDENLLIKSHESWVFVNVITKSEYGVLQGFPEQMKGVITWQNSD